MNDMDALIAAAKAVRKNAHAPYSRYQVGAAVRGDDGKIYAGCNVENASYGLALCAERGAVAQAIAAGAKKITAAAVITSTSPPAAPCGMCRQTLAEFARDLPIALINDAGERVDVTLAELLPRAFRSEDLP
ncbi:MAG TPA: cytidine deaminase [Polyangia bacterium]|nr:cytidine deaminase [Polyangia bacterium]